MFRYVERCCVFASLVLCVCARVVGFVGLLVLVGLLCFSVVLSGGFVVGLMPLSYIFRGGVARFLFFLEPLASCFVLVCLVALFFW